MSAFVSLKPELSENRMGAQWDSWPGTSDDSANLNPFDAQVAQVAGLLKKEGRFPTPSATAPLTRMASKRTNIPTMSATVIVTII